MNFANNLLRGVAAALLALSLGVAASCATAGKGRKLPPPTKVRAADFTFEPIEFQAPKPQIRTLSNGIKVYLLEDHELPTLSVRVIFPNGALNVPLELTGLDSMLSSVWRNSGSTRFPKDQLNEELEFLAASIETDVGNRDTDVTMRCLSKDWTKVMDMMHDLILQPNFGDEEIELARMSQLENIRRRNDRPNGILMRVLRQRFYGEGSVLAAESTTASVNGLHRHDLVDFHRRIIGPKSTVITAVGSFHTPDMMRELEARFGRLSNPQQEEAILPKPIDFVTPGVYVVNKPLSQTSLSMTQLGLPRHHPDHFAVQVMNEIFGSGGFNSRLMQEARSNRGLTYGISGYLTMDDYNGRFLLSTSTKNSSVREIVDVSIGVMRRMMDEPITQQELEQAKNTLLNSYVFSFASSGQIVNTRVSNDRNGYPEDWIEQYVPGISKVTIEDVQRVARENLRPDNLIIVLVGPEDDIRKQLVGYAEPLSVQLTD